MEITKNLRELMIDLRLSGIIPTLEERMNYAKQNALCFDEFLQIAFLALKTGFEVTFVRSDKMFKHLFSSLVDGTHERTLKFYIKPQLLIIDDFATKAMTREEASDLYEIILERYEKKSTIVTSARAVDEWQPLFPDPILGNSVLDRLAHSSYQILMEGESIRKQKRPK